MNTQASLLSLAAFVFVSCTGLQLDADSGSSKVLFEDDMMSNWQENWFLDGKEATLEHRDEGLFFSGGKITKPMDREKYHAHHAVLWTKQVIEGDIKITFEMTRVDHSGYGNTLLYIMAQGVIKGSNKRVHNKFFPNSLMRHFCDPSIDRIDHCKVRF